MVYDLVHVKNDTVEFDTETGRGEKIKKKSILNEKDELWLKYRFKHIAEVTNTNTKK